MPKKEKNRNRIFIALGSNLGDRTGTIQNALSDISRDVGIIINCSSFYESEPWGEKDQNGFINAMCELETDLLPVELLHQLRIIEQKYGKTSLRTWGPRTLDLDIIYYGKKIIVEKDLIIPHHNMYLRNFVLAPLAEIAPEFIHPILKKKTKSLLRDCPDTNKIVRIKTGYRSINEG